MPPRFGDRDRSVEEHDTVVSSLHSRGSEGGRLGSGGRAMCSGPDLACALFLIVHTLGSSSSTVTGPCFVVAALDGSEMLAAVCT